MATVDQLIIEILARDNGAEETLEKLHERLGEILSEAQTASRKAMGASSDAAKKTGEDIGKVGQKADETTKKIGETGKKSVDMFTKLRGAALRFIGVFALFSFGKKIVSDAMDSAVSLGKLSKASGVARQEIEALQKAGEKKFIDKETVNGLISQISQARADFDAGKAASNEFLRKMNLAGVNVYDKNNKFRTDAANMLLEAGEYYRKRAGGDETKAIALARGQSNFSEEEARFIISMKREDYKASRDLIKTTNEEYEAAEHAARQWAETKQRLEKLGQQIAMKLIPIFEKLLEWLNEFAEELQKDPDLINKVIVMIGALVIAIGAIFNPIGTAIGLFVGLMGVLYKVTNRFEFVRKAWDGMVLAIKSGVNELTGALAKFLRWVGMDELADKVESFKFDTSAEEASVNSPTQAGANGESNPTEYESTGETLPDYSGRSQEALGKSSGGAKAETAASWSGGSTDLERWAAANVKNEAGSTGGVGKNGKPLLHLNSGKKFGKYNGTYDVGKYQLNELNGPFAAKIAGQSWDRNRFFNDVAYANSLGLAYMKHAYSTAMRMFGNSPAKAFAYYHSPKAMVEAQKHGSGWLEYLRVHYPGVYQSTTRKMSFLNKGIGAKNAMSASATGGSASYSVPSNRTSVQPVSQGNSPQPAVTNYSVPQKTKTGQPSAQVADAISNAARITGMDERMMFGIAKAESGFKPRAGAKTSSAKGLYQFISGTWGSMVERYGSKYGLSYGGIYDPRQNAIAGALYAKENAQSLRNDGFEANAANLYMAHFLGPAGAKRFLRALRRNPNASSLTGAEPGQVSANKSIFYRGHYVKIGPKKYRFVPESPRTLAEVYSLLRQRSSWNGNISSKAPKPVQQPKQPVQNEQSFGGWNEVMGKAGDWWGMQQNQQPSQVPVHPSAIPEQPTVQPERKPPRSFLENLITRAGNMVGGVFGNIKDRLRIPEGLKMPDLGGLRMPDFGMQPAMAGIGSAYPAGAKQVTYINNSKTINVTNHVNVDARGNNNPKQVAEKTSQGVDTVSRRLARATL